MTELRKEKGLSQKDAAAKLGISQALLSHYEKGIRECGQNFLIKAADFYGVSCDYLLGRSPSRIESDGVSYFSQIEYTDNLPIRKTLLKAIGLVTSEIALSEYASHINLDNFIQYQLYKIILIEASLGNLPANWAGKAFVDGEPKVNPVFLGLIENCALEELMKEPKTKSEEKPIPDAVKTILRNTEKQVLAATLDKLPPIPLELI